MNVYSTGSFGAVSDPICIDLHWHEYTNTSLGRTEQAELGCRPTCQAAPSEQSWIKIRSWTQCHSSILFPTARECKWVPLKHSTPQGTWKAPHAQRTLGRLCTCGSRHFSAGTAQRSRFFEALEPQTSRRSDCNVPIGSAHSTAVHNHCWTIITHWHFLLWCFA